MLRSWTAALLLVVAATPLAAQTDRASRFMENCRRDRSDNEQFCETRNFTLAATKTISVDGRENGGVTVHGWDERGVRVLAMIQTQAETEAEASALAKQISIATSNAEVRAEGPSMGRRESWSVSYEVWVPRTTDLSIMARNGGISVDGIASRMELETVNGGLHLTDVEGDVRGTTVNGGVTAELSGDHWTGSGLDLRTSNGGVHLTIPSNYSARLETSTVNGGMDIGFPITVQGSLSHRLATQLGRGGATIRAVTTNGGISIRQR
jgi:DUF4097 and DUF4098 domain-containing protein YvlB